MTISSLLPIVSVSAAPQEVEDARSKYAAIEANIAEINEEISGLDTIYVRAGILGSISSSTVRELYKNGKDVSKYVPEEIRKIM